MTRYNPKSKDRYRELVADALRSIDDPSALRTNPLCRLGAIEDVARKRYSSSPLSKARALRQVLLVCCDRAASDAREPFKTFLHLYTQGEPIAMIARKIGRSREHCSNVYRRLAVELVSEEFQDLVENADLTDSSNDRLATTRRAASDTGIAFSISTPNSIGASVNNPRVR